MQTVGAAQLVVRRCSPACMWVAAQDSRSAHGLLYVAAVRHDRLPGPLLHDSQIGELRRAVAWTACPPNLASGSGRPACQPDRWLFISYLEERDCPCCNERVSCPLPKLAVRLANSPPNQITGNLAA